MTDPDLIRARPHGSILVFAVLSLLFGLFGGIEAGTPGHDASAGWLIAAMFGGAGLALTVHALTNALTADASGLRYRRWGKKLAAPWPDVVDVHDVPCPKHPHQSHLRIETRAWAVTLDGNWINVDAMRQAVVLYTGKSAGFPGTRPGDTPRTFTYDAKSLRRRSVIFALAPVVIVAAYTLPWLPKLPRLAGQVGWGAALALCAPMLVLATLYLMLLAAFRVPDAEARKRLGQRITADPDGITFEGAGRTLRASWPEVVALSVQSAGRFVKVSCLITVETANGAFDFVPTISNGPMLRRTIEERAKVNLRDADSEHEVLVPEHPAQPGVRLYTYRTRTNRALLGLPAGLALCCLLLAALNHFGLTPNGNTAASLALAGVFAALTLAAWSRYATVSVRTDPLGITWQGPARRVFIPWTDVRSYTFTNGDAASYATVAGSQARIRIWFGISDFRALESEIRNNAPALQIAGFSNHRDTEAQRTSGTE